MPRSCSSYDMVAAIMQYHSSRTSLPGGAGVLDAGRPPLDDHGL
jgi:hypothetical protein